MPTTKRWFPNSQHHPRFPPRHPKRNTTSTTPPRHPMQPLKKTRSNPPSTPPSSVSLTGLPRTLRKSSVTSSTVLPSSTRAPTPSQHASVLPLAGQRHRQHRYRGSRGARVAVPRECLSCSWYLG